MNQIANEKWEERLKANDAARQLKDIEPSKFALANPNKWNSSFLKRVLDQYSFLLKLKKKLPSWYQNYEILGFGAKAIAQCSSATTGKYKFKSFKGLLALDLCGGFGVDTYFLAKNFEKVIYCEADKDLLETVRYNFEKLGVGNVEFRNQKAEDFLNATKEFFDLIYIDPDRRSLKTQKIVLLEDCQPNLIEIQEKILQKTKKLLIKSSPLLDIPRALKQLAKVEKVEVVAIKNEVKELLFTSSPTINQEVLKIASININTKQKDFFCFTIQEEKEAVSVYSRPLSYLYEPNAALLKSGAFKSIGAQLKLAKIAKHTHYYTSEQLITDFPGKKFKINEIAHFNKKNLKKLRDKKTHVLARNFPLKTEVIRKQFRLKTGGETYLIFTQTANNEKIVLTCEKL